MSRAVGVDVGTLFFQVAEKEGSDLKYKTIRNAFVEMADTEEVENALKQNGWQFVKDGRHYYVIGEDAIQVANIFPGKVEIRRPMQDGVLNKDEDKKLVVLAEIIRSSIGEAKDANSWVCTCVSSESVDGSANSTFHRQRLEAMFKRLGWQVKIIEEGHAVVLAERPSMVEDGVEIPYSGIGLSFGAGRANCVLAYKGLQVIGMSVAKCLAEDTKVFTSRGVVEIQDIEVGDVVFDAFGRECSVLRVIDNGVRDQLLRISLNNLAAFPLECTRDHMIWVKGINGWKWVTAEEIAIGDVVGERIVYCSDKTPSALYIGRENGASVRPMKSRNLGRFFGAFLGDGNTNIDADGYGYVQLAFNSSETLLVDKYSEVCSKLWDCDTSVTSDGDTGLTRLKVHRSYLANYLKQNCYDKNGEKKMPLQEFDIPDQMALGIIEGLLDTDGCLTSNRASGYQFYNTSLSVASLFHKLLLRFGIQHSFSVREPRLGGVNSRGVQIFGRKKSYEIKIPVLASRLLDAFLSLENHGLTYQRSEYAEYSVSSVAAFDYGKNVYDLSVSSDHHSFGVFGAIVHNCGDWIDKQVSEQTGVPISQVISTKEKKLDFENIDLDDDVQFALDAYYDAMIRYVFKHFAEKFASEKSRFNAPLDIVVAGGTSMPKGFCKKLEKIVRELSLPFQIKEVRHAKNPRNAVVEGLCIHAEVCRKKGEKGDSFRA